MASQTDLDQGGTARQYQQIWLGPSVGWVTFPVTNPVSIITTGTTTLENGSTLVLVNYNGTVSIQLWDPLTALPAGTLPGKNVGYPLTIVDIGGHASDVNIITVLPAATRTIDGLSSWTITNSFGGVILKPNLTTGNWTTNP